MAAMQASEQTRHDLAVLLAVIAVATVVGLICVAVATDRGREILGALAGIIFFGGCFVFGLAGGGSLPDDYG